MDLEVIVARVQDRKIRKTAKVIERKVKELNKLERK
jgi:hypothetical protein